MNENTQKELKAYTVYLVNGMTTIVYAENETEALWKAREELIALRES